MTTLTRATGVVKRIAALIVRFYLLVAAGWGAYYAFQGELVFAAIGLAPLVAYVAYVAWQSYRGVPAAGEPAAE